LLRFLFVDTLPAGNASCNGKDYTHHLHEDDAFFNSKLLCVNRLLRFSAKNAEIRPVLPEIDPQVDPQSLFCSLFGTDRDAPRAVAAGQDQRQKQVQCTARGGGVVGTFVQPRGSALTEHMLAKRYTCRVTESGGRRRAALYAARAQMKPLMIAGVQHGGQVGFYPFCMFSVLELQCQFIFYCLTM